MTKPLQDIVGVTRVPTYIPSVDKVLNGGLALGSTVLIIAEPGAGGQEFLQTSAVNFYRSMQEQKPAGANIHPPHKIYYISQKSTKKTFYNFLSVQYNLFKFEGETEEDFENHINYYDAGDIYFARSIVPPRWYTEKSITEHILDMPVSDEFGGFSILANRVSQVKPNSLVFVDSLTPYLPFFATPEKWLSLLELSYGLSRVAKKNHLNYVFLLTSGVLPRSREIELGNGFDAVIDLSWQKSQNSMNRQRQMYFEKYHGVMPTMSARDIATFNVTIAPETGFEISNLRRVT
ncbi:MAG: hypothetical protein Q4Q04_03695 [Methanocorpusculum sp.]|nr:hypothetical protein [Methanocorpusculum sp.]